jgi:hypothetical protein
MANSTFMESVEILCEILLAYFIASPARIANNVTYWDRYMHYSAK